MQYWLWLYYLLLKLKSATEEIDYYQISICTSHILKGSRQVASGILFGIKNEMLAKHWVIQEMEEDDKLEAVLVKIW